MKRYGIVAGVLLLGAGLAACAGAPVLTQPPTKLPGDKRALVAVCYRESNTTEEEVRKVAASGCPWADSTVTPVKDDVLFNNCPAVKKRRITFVCNAPPNPRPNRNIEQPLTPVQVR